MTTQSKSTPAPWGVLLAPTQVVAGEKVIVHSMGNNDPASFGEQLANARLIAKSPVMRELLYLALPYIEEGEEFNKPSGKTLSKKVRKLLLELEEYNV